MNRAPLQGLFDRYEDHPGEYRVTYPGRIVSMFLSSALYVKGLCLWGGKCIYAASVEI